MWYDRLEFSTFLCQPYSFCILLFLRPRAYDAIPFQILPVVVCMHVHPNGRGIRNLSSPLWLQSEFGKRILRLSKHHADLAPIYIFGEHRSPLCANAISTVGMIPREPKGDIVH